MSPVGRYDGDLQMFVEEPRELNQDHLRFLRWLVEHRQLEHPVAGPPPDDGRRGGPIRDGEPTPVGAARPSAPPYPDPFCVPPWFGR
jgi:hypothetical protein